MSPLAERKKYVKKWLRQRYAKLIAMPKWSEEELEELGDGLNQYITASIEWRDWIKARLAW